MIRVVEGGFFLEFVSDFLFSFSYLCFSSSPSYIEMISERRSSCWEEEKKRNSRKTGKWFVARKIVKL